MDIPVQILNQMQPDRQEAKEILMPLLQASVDNIKKLGVEQALTGPISRGDVQTVRNHVALLKKKHPELLSVYCVLGMQALKLSQKRGDIDHSTLRTLQQILELKWLKLHQSGRKILIYI